MFSAVKTATEWENKMAEIKEIRKFRPKVKAITGPDFMLMQQEFPSGVFKTVRVSVQEMIDDFFGSGGSTAPTPWYKEFTLPPATSSTPVIFLTNAEVGAGNRAEIVDWTVTIDGAVGGWGDNAEEGFIKPTSDPGGEDPITLDLTRFASVKKYIRDRPVESADNRMDIKMSLLPLPEGDGLTVSADGDEVAIGANDLLFRMWGFIVPV